MSKNKDIREAVEAEFGFDPLVDAADIAVMNVNGDVALNGTVPSYPQYLEAAAAAQHVDGVKKVHNHLEVVLPPGDYRDDAMLTTAANNALTLNITVPDGVEATARDGNLTLSSSLRQASPSGWISRTRPMRSLTSWPLAWGCTRWRSRTPNSLASARSCRFTGTGSCSSASASMSSSASRSKCTVTTPPDS